MLSTHQKNSFSRRCVASPVALAVCSQAVLKKSSELTGCRGFGCDKQRCWMDKYPTGPSFSKSKCFSITKTTAAIRLVLSKNCSTILVSGGPKLCDAHQLSGKMQNTIAGSVSGNCLRFYCKAFLTVSGAKFGAVKAVTSTFTVSPSRTA